MWMLTAHHWSRRDLGGSQVPTLGLPRRLPKRWWQQISKKWAPRTHDNTPTKVESGSCSAPRPISNGAHKSARLFTAAPPNRREDVKSSEDSLAFASCVKVCLRFADGHHSYFLPLVFRCVVYRWKSVLFFSLFVISKTNLKSWRQRYSSPRRRLLLRAARCQVRRSRTDRRRWWKPPPLPPKPKRQTRGSADQRNPHIRT